MDRYKVNWCVCHTDCIFITTYIVLHRHALGRVIIADGLSIVKESGRFKEGENNTLLACLLASNEQGKLPTAIDPVREDRSCFYTSLLSLAL